MDIEAYLRRQAGVIGHEQARAAGMSGSAVTRRVATGRWVRLHPRVYLAADRERTDEVRLRAAVLWAGPGAVAHGVSAAWWHDLGPRRLPACVDVTVPRRRWPGRRPGVQVRRRDVDALDLTHYRDLPVTGLALTALEASVALGPAGSVLLDRALQQHVDFGWVHRAALPQPGPLRLSGGLGAAHRGRRPRLLASRALAGRPAARRWDHRLGARVRLSGLSDRCRVSRTAGRDRG